MKNELKYKSFYAAQQFSRSLKLKSQKHWRNYCKSNNKPQDIPAAPEVVYKKNWHGYGDWLGTFRKRSTKFREFNNARKFARSLRLKGELEWMEYCSSGKRPIDIPASPHTTYSKEWKGYGDWLGTFRTRTTNSRNFKDARRFTRSLGLKTREDWNNFCRTTNKPNDIPISPRTTYINEWKGFRDWLNSKA